MDTDDIWAAVADGRYGEAASEQIEELLHEVKRLRARYEPGVHRTTGHVLTRVRDLTINTMLDGGKHAEFKIEPASAFLKIEGLTHEFADHKQEGDAIRWFSSPDQPRPITRIAAVRFRVSGSTSGYSYRIES